ncbi:MAG: hypothetical protein IJV05_10920 [Muribaculaceae bacterium]|nr:hypothetical protein [Muribaculaceae bacterium]
MINSKELNTDLGNCDYQQAEQMINEAIANMEEMTHIEYESTMQRKSQQSKFKKWVTRLSRMLR